MNKKGFTHLVKALRKNQSSAKLMQPPSRFLLTGLRYARPSAFTLAEVLITLSILGVVAAISIPNIIQQYQKRLIITKLQKAYANIEKAATNIAVSTGCIGRDISCCINTFNNAGDIDSLFAELSGMKTTKKYSANWLQSEFMYPNKFSSFHHYFITTDGIGYNVEVKADKLQIMVLLEPYKIKPVTRNIIKRGRNQFYFVIYDNFMVSPAVFGSDAILHPLLSTTSDGTINNGCNYTTSTSISGMNCAARIIRDGWKMNY